MCSVPDGKKNETEEAGGDQDHEGKNNDELLGGHLPGSGPVSLDLCLWSSYAR